MKRKIAGLQRWLDRLSVACDSRKWKSAVAEADCLSAELRQVREELWEKAEEEAAYFPAAESIKGRIYFIFRIVAVAVVVICFSTMPIAVESSSPQKIATLPIGGERSKSEEFVLVTSEEKELLQLLRENLNESNVAIKTVENAAPKKDKIFTAKTLQNTHVEPIRKTPVKVASAVKQRADAGIKAEDLLTLIQIGEKSLRGENSAIKYVN